MSRKELWYNRITIIWEFIKRSDEGNMNSNAYWERLVRDANETILQADDRVVRKAILWLLDEFERERKNAKLL
ncbi:MAG: hypothetical protein KBT03_01920 [Bacteroidales bacterium]|nr:hypothetical protein [Candidatus Scybalousia scybalohippi]